MIITKKGKANTIYLILILIASFIFVECFSPNESTGLTKLSQNELLDLCQNFNKPIIKELTIRNFDGDSITYDSLKKIFIRDQHAFDYYKNATGKVVECQIRNYAKQDEAFYRELRRTKVKLTQVEINDIKGLETPKQKSEYLHNLWREDQNLRKGQDAEIIVKFGHYSNEHKDYLKNSIEQDGRIFIKLKTYLEIHGYPEKSELYHELALNAFPIIIGHNHNYDEQLELIQYLYKSYREGACELSELLWIMGEMHESKYGGKRYKMKTNHYTEVNEFIELNEVLNLGFELNSDKN